MRIITIVLFLVYCSVSCKNKTAEEPVTPEVKEVAAPAPPPPVDLPFTATYSSDWSIGDPKFTKLALDFYKGLENDSIPDMSAYIEDSIQFRSFDNTIETVSKEEILKRVKSFRKGFKTLTETFPAFVSLHSNDKNEDWVSLWIHERGIRTNGKPDSTHYQENWRFRNGRVYFVADFARFKPSK